MIELKILNGVNAIYRGAVRLGLRSVKRKETKSYKRFEKKLDVADSAQKMSAKLAKEAREISDAAFNVHADEIEVLGATEDKLKSALDNVKIYA